MKPSTILFSISGRVAALLLLVLTISGCGAVDTLFNLMSADEAPIYVEVGDGYPAYIFPASTAASSGAHYLLNNGDTATYWTPTAADVKLAEQAFQTEVVHQLAATSPMEGQKTPIEEVQELIPEYYRQYFGFIQDGEHQIYGTYFCQTFPGWGETLMMVEDGGACVVEWIYNLDDGTIPMFMIHGQA